MDGQLRTVSLTDDLDFICVEVADTIEKAEDIIREHNNIPMNDKISFIKCDDYEGIDMLFITDNEDIMPFRLVVFNKLFYYGFIDLKFDEK